jgi:ribosomal protein L10
MGISLKDLVFMRLPFNLNLPFVGEKTKLLWTSYEDDLFTDQYMIKVNGEFPESIVKGIYDLVLKKNMKVTFKAGLLDGETLDVPVEFFNQKVGIFTWEEVLMKQLDKVFREVSVRSKWLLVTKHIQAMKIKMVSTKYYVYFEIIGRKTKAMK